MPGLATICVLFSHKANGEKAHKYRLCRHLPSYIGLGLKIVSRLKENRLNEENGQPINKTDLQALDELTHYMDEHYSFNITLQTLSTIACMSESKMKKLFKSVYNMSITEYIQRKRISVAEHMLIQTDLTIAEISRIVGYSNPSRLIEIFKRYYGFTPSKYRK